MNTKLLMISSAMFMGVTGILFSFAPHEIINYLSVVPDTTSASASLVLQILGALYFSFAMINWTAKANLIGGIYSRPIAIGNLVHFTIGSLTLIKGCMVTPATPILVAASIYSVYAVLFGVVFFTHPLKK